MGNAQVAKVGRELAHQELNAACQCLTTKRNLAQSILVSLNLPEMCAYMAQIWLMVDAQVEKVGKALAHLAEHAASHCLIVTN